MTGCDIHVESLTAGYQGKPVLRDVSFDLGSGEILAVIGPNGSGKTTLLRALSGILKPYSGSISICGAEPRRVRDRILFIPASPAVDDYLLGVDVVLLHRYGLSENLYWGKKDFERAADSLRRLRAVHLAETKWGWMSSGQRRLTSLAGALARGSRASFLDEPFAFLDLSNQVLVARTLKEMKEETTIVYTAHNPLHTTIADKVLVMSEGRMVAYGEPSKTLVKDVLEQVYKVKVEVVELNGIKLPIPVLE